MSFVSDLKKRKETENNASVCPLLPWATKTLPVHPVSPPPPLTMELT